MLFAHVSIAMFNTCTTCEADCCMIVCRRKHLLYWRSVKNENVFVLNIHCCSFFAKNADNQYK